MELHYVILLTLFVCVYGEDIDLTKIRDKQIELEKSYTILADLLTGALETIDSLSDTVDVLKSQPLDGGSTYIRWGRTTCPDNVVLVHTGYSAGAHHTHSGGGANYLCLPAEPIMENHYGSQKTQGQIYGAEYEIGDPYTNYNVPCAVCRIPRTSVLMIPGRNICYKGWTLEYSGNLASGLYNHAHASEHVCLDANPEKDEAVHTNEDGASFYYVVGRCGYLPCPPYRDREELSCAVCSYSAPP